MKTFSFEELDSTTRDYLTAVRDSQGEGAPGVFAPTSSTMAGCGCISGVVVIAATLALTLTDWVDMVFREPTRVAMLQTAGLLLGGWLLVAAMRSAAARGSKSYAGHWVYVDPLHLYEAYREQVTVTPVAGVSEANFTHNYNNGSYQNSVVRVLLDGGRASVTINNEAKAEQIVVFLNYLAWARGAEGGDRAKLPPAQLGGLARYVAEHDVEPKNHDETLNLDLTHTAFDAVPEEPAREGRAAPSVLPYVVLVAAGFGIFFLMKEVVNPPLHDDAMFKAVTTEPVEPMFLRAYLIDERNTRHRQEVLTRLGEFYGQATKNVRQGGTDPVLREGMAKLLESLDGPDQPTVSLMVRERGERAGDPAAQARVDTLRKDLVGGVEKQGTAMNNRGGIVGELSKSPGLDAVRPPSPDVVFPEPRWPRGSQLIDFAGKPDDADHAHVEVVYEFVPAGNGRYTLSAVVEIRPKLDAGPVVTGHEVKIAGEVSEAEFGRQLESLKAELVRGLVGNWSQPGFGGLPGGGFVPPK